MPALSPQAQNWTHRKAHANMVRAFDVRVRALNNCDKWWEDREYLRLMHLATILIIHMDAKDEWDHRWFPFWIGVAG